MIVVGIIIVFWVGLFVLVSTLAIRGAGRETVDHWHDPQHDERRAAAELHPVTGQVQAAPQNGRVHRGSRR